jgi:hypothetical protein
MLNKEINIDEIPDYAINLGDGEYLWRHYWCGVSSGVGRALITHFKWLSLYLPK